MFLDLAELTFIIRLDIIPLIGFGSAQLISLQSLNRFCDEGASLIFNFVELHLAGIVGSVWSLLSELIFKTEANRFLGALVELVEVDAFEASQPRVARLDSMFGALWSLFGLVAAAWRHLRLSAGESGKIVLIPVNLPNVGVYCASFLSIRPLHDIVVHENNILLAKLTLVEWIVRLIKLSTSGNMSSNSGERRTFTSLIDSLGSLTVKTTNRVRNCLQVVLVREVDPIVKFSCCVLLSNRRSEFVLWPLVLWRRNLAFSDGYSFLGDLSEHVVDVAVGVEKEPSSTS